MTVRSTAPWSAADARVCGAAAVAATAGLLWAWWGASGTAGPRGQGSWLALGVAALVVLGFGQLVWLTAGRRAVRARRRHVLGRAEAFEAAISARGGGTPLRSTGGEVVVASPAGSRYHRPGCLLAASDDVRPASHAVRVRRGLQPCEMCEP